MKKKLMLIGGGGHCLSVLDSTMALGKYDEIGIIDSKDNSNLCVPVIGTDEDITSLIKQGWNEAFITVGSVGDTIIRRRLYEMAKEYKLIIPAIIDPSALVSKDVEIREGVYIGKRAVVNAGSSVGICSIINTGAIIEHNCRIGDFSHVSSGATICGHVSVNHDAHIGAGSVVRQLITIEANSFIGAGSVVVEDIPKNVKAYGNPCRVVKK